MYKHSYYWYCFRLLLRYQAAASPATQDKRIPTEPLDRTPWHLNRRTSHPHTGPQTQRQRGPRAATAAGAAMTAGTTTGKEETGARNRFSYNTTQVLCMPELLSSPSFPPAVANKVEGPMWAPPPRNQLGPLVR